MGLGLINCLLLSRHEIHVNLKVQQNLQPTKMIMKRLVKMMMMTTLLLCQRKYMYQFDPEKNKKREQEQTLSEIVGVVKSMVDKDPMKDLVSMVREEMKQSRAWSTVISTNI